MGIVMVLPHEVVERIKYVKEHQAGGALSSSSSQCSHALLEGLHNDCSPGDLLLRVLVLWKWKIGTLTQVAWLCIHVLFNPFQSIPPSRWNGEQFGCMPENEGMVDLWRIIKSLRAFIPSLLTDERIVFSEQAQTSPLGHAGFKVLLVCRRWAEYGTGDKGTIT